MSNSKRVLRVADKTRGAAGVAADEEIAQQKTVAARRRRRDGSLKAGQRPGEGDKAFVHIWCGRGTGQSPDDGIIFQCRSMII